jgi:hypothetical protein
VRRWTEFVESNRAQLGHVGTLVVTARTNPQIESGIGDERTHLTVVRNGRNGAHSGLSYDIDAPAASVLAASR